MPAGPGSIILLDMGFLKKLTGGTDTKLLQTGLLGQGVIADMQMTGTTVQKGNGLVERACIFTVEINLDGRDPYTASCKQRIPEVAIPQIRAGGTMLAVRVDPADPQNIALDFDSPVPTVTLAPNKNQTAAELLASGERARAVIVESMPLNRRNQAGVDLYAFTLTVSPPGRDPYQIQVGNPMPAKALPLLYAGSHVPVAIGATPNAVAIDWDGALAESRG